MGWDRRALSSGEASTQHFPHISPLFLVNPGRFYYKNETCALPGSASPPRAQVASPSAPVQRPSVVVVPLRPAPGLCRAPATLPTPRQESPAGRRSPDRPRRVSGCLASGPPGPQGGAREAAAKGLRLPQPARPTAPGPRFPAGSHRRRSTPSLSPETATARALLTVSLFSSTTAGRKAKAKTSGGRGRAWGRGAVSAGRAAGASAGDARAGPATTA